MGYHADQALDEVIFHEEKAMEYRHGLMSPGDAYDLGIIDELGYEIGSEARSKICRCCKTPNLHWVNRKGRWLLANEDGIHMCKKVPIKL